MGPGRIQNVLLLVTTVLVAVNVLPLIYTIQFRQRAHNSPRSPSTVGVDVAGEDAPLAPAAEPEPVDLVGIRVEQEQEDDIEGPWSMAQEDKLSDTIEFQSTVVSTSEYETKGIQLPKDQARMEENEEQFHSAEPRQPTPEGAYINVVQKQGSRMPEGAVPIARTLNQWRSIEQQYRWVGWFESDGKESMKLDTLSDYVTEDITPAAIEAQLSQCTTVLGVSQKTLENQHDDLEKTSIKLSAFLSAVKSLLPDSFSSRYASPCWLSDKINGQSNVLESTERALLEDKLSVGFSPNNAAYLAQQAFGGPFPKKMFCLPQFFIAGFPKSATTTMADALFEHPRIASVVDKGTHWWTRAPIIAPDANLLKLNVLRYLLRFGHMTYYATVYDRLLSMDAGQSTLWDSNFVFNGHDFCSTPAAISHILPKAKFIVLMREPSERLYSYYLWSCSYTYGNDTTKWPSKIRNDPAGNFHSEASQVVFDFNQCLQSRSLYECSIQYTFTNSTKATNYCGQIGFRLVVSIYYIHIVKFLQFFPQEQFLFLKMEDMTQEPIRFMKQVTTFLDIESYPPSKISDLLERKHNQQKANIEPMHEDTRRLLHTFYGPFNRQLADLLKDKRFLWDYS